MIKKDVISGCTWLHSKQYLSSPQWEPKDGCQFLFHIPSTTVYGANKMSLETKTQMHSELIDEHTIFWMQALKEKIKHIDNAKKYVVQQER